MATQQELIVDEPREQAADLQHAMMSLPAEAQERLLTEYVERRNAFRHWLKAQFEEGLHYGFPPGCEPKQTNPKQWQAKPSLYAAGADLLCDLLRLRCEFAADVEAWTQLGSVAGSFVIVCKLYSRANGDLIGEGRGVRKVGQKGGDANNAIKMAQKCAKVDAVLNSYGLRDLYSQDLETPNQLDADNPPADPEAPKAQPRAERQQAVTKEQLAELLAAWRARNPEPTGNTETWNRRWCEWVCKTAGREFAVMRSGEWTDADYTAVDAALT